MTPTWKREELARTRQVQTLVESAADAAWPFLVHLPEGAELVVYENGGWTIEVGQPEGDAIAIAPADTDYQDVEAVIATLNDTVDDDLPGVAGG